MSVLQSPCSACENKSKHCKKIHAWFATTSVQKEPLPRSTCPHSQNSSRGGRPRHPWVLATATAPPRNHATDLGSSSRYWMRRVKWWERIHQRPAPSRARPVKSWDRCGIVTEGQGLEVTGDRRGATPPALTWAQRGCTSLGSLKKCLFCIGSSRETLTTLQVPLWKHLL